MAHLKPLIFLTYFLVSPALFGVDIVDALEKTATPTVKSSGGWFSKKPAPKVGDYPKESIPTVCVFLLNNWALPDTQRIANLRINPDTNERGYLTPLAYNGLKSLLELPEGHVLIRNKLIEWGLVQATKDDPHYAELVLAGENRDVVNLGEPYYDYVDPLDPKKGLSTKVNQAVTAFLRYRIGKKLPDPPFLRAAGRNNRLSFLMEKIVQILLVHTQDEEMIGSQNAINVIFAQLEELRMQYKQDSLLDRTQYRKAVAKKLGQLIAAGRVRGRSPIRRLKAASVFIDLSLSFFGIGVATDAAEKVYTYFWDTDRRANTYPKEVQQMESWEEMVPGTLTFFIKGHDPEKYSDKVVEFFARHGIRDEMPAGEMVPGTDTSNELFVPAFADEIKEVFPESRLVLHRSSLVQNAYSSTASEGLIDGRFGRTSPEGEKYLNREALMLALLRNEGRYFSRLSQNEFAELRQAFLSDLALVDSDGTFHFSNLDRFNVFLMLDPVGRGKSSFGTALDNYYGISERTGSDYERRTVEFFNRFPHYSPHYIRKDEESRDTIKYSFDLTFHVNPGQIIQREGSWASFAQLVGKPKLQLMMVYWRSILSFMALPHDYMNPGTTLYDSMMHRKWMRLRKQFIQSSEPGADYKVVYNSGLEEGALDFGLRLKDVSDDALPAYYTIARLADQARMVGTGENVLNSLGMSYSLLSADEKETLETFLHEYPTLVYFSADLAAAIQKGRGPLGDGRHIWMKFLVRVFKRMQQHANFETYLRQTLDEEKEMRLGLKAALNYVQALSPEEIPQLLEVPITVKWISGGAYEVGIQQPPR